MNEQEQEIIRTHVEIIEGLLMAIWDELVELDVPNRIE